MEKNTEVQPKPLDDGQEGKELKTKEEIFKNRGFKNDLPYAQMIVISINTIYQVMEEYASQFKKGYFIETIIGKIYEIKLDDNFSGHYHDGGEMIKNKIINLLRAALPVS